jgi:hypothetical protein
VGLKVPTAHAEHSPPSGPVYPGLHSQLPTTLLPLGELEAAGQLAQVPTTDAPVVPEYLPASQFTHVPAATAPTVVEYLPATQSTQSLPFSERVLVRYLPAAQSVHASGPISSLYFPVAHSKHSPPFCPVYPAIHSQLVAALLPRGETELVGHVWQVLAPEAPSVVEKVSMPHSKQLAAV